MTVYLIAYVRRGKVMRLDIDRMKPSERYIAQMLGKGITTEYYAIRK